MESYIRLAIQGLLPTLFTVLFFFLEKKTAFSRWNYWLKQSIIGICFGGLAVIGTEFGVTLEGAVINCRDGAVLTAGLLFGGPAGIIAGAIGGLERYFAVYWGVGSFTQIACSVSTFVAGLYAAFLRRFMFEKKRPDFLMAFLVGIVMEVFHLTMVFITNMDETTRAMAVVKACTIPMLAANASSVGIATFVLMLLEKGKNIFKKSIPHISETIQRALLLVVLVAFFGTSFFVYRLQTAIADNQINSTLSLAISDVSKDIEDASDRNLLNLAYRVKMRLENADEPLSDALLKRIALEEDVSEVNIIKHAYIIYSNIEDNILFDMTTGAQSVEFMNLLYGTQELVQKYGPIAMDENIYRKYAGVAWTKEIKSFIQVGFDSTHFQNDLHDEIILAVQNRHVGENGFLFILDADGEVVSAPSEDMKTIIKESVDIHDLPKENDTYEFSINGKNYFGQYVKAEGFFIISVLPEEEALEMRNTVLYVNTYMEILAFGVLFYFMYLLIKRIVVKRLQKVNKSLNIITQGNLDEVVDVHSTLEFADLSGNINQTVGTLKHYIEEASARIDKELELARSIQASALPNIFPAFPQRKDFDIYATMRTAKEVGGDFYDFYLTHTNTLNFLIADVSGKGIPAAMFMMRAKTQLKSLTETDKPMGEIFTSANDSLCEGNDAGMFVTAWQGQMDLTTGHVTFANAGHNPPLVLHADGTVGFEYLKSRVGLVLAGMEGMPYKTQEMDLKPGDTLLLYTDGVTEATNANNELYGEERLQTYLNSRTFANMNELLDGVLGEIDAFVGEAPQFDDITMVGLRYYGKTTLPQLTFEEASLQDIPKIQAFVEEELEKIGANMKSVVQLDVAIDEMYSNIVKYAYAKKPGPATVRLLYMPNIQSVALTFIDEGAPYNPITKEDPDVTLSAEEREIGGLGIFVVKKTMDDVKYKYEKGQNILTLVKKI